MHEHFVLLAIAVLFEFNKIASSRSRWRSNVNCAGNIFNKGNVICGNHRARTCSQCPCNEQGVIPPKGSRWCNGDCQWRGGHRDQDRHGECIRRRKINKGEWKCTGLIYDIFITSVPSLHSMTIFASFQTAWPRSALFTGVTMCPPLCSQMLKAAGLHAGPMVKITLPGPTLRGAIAKTPMQEECKWINV